MAKTFLTEIQHRPDGASNTSVKSYSSEAVGLSQYYARASQAVATTDYTGVILTLKREDGYTMQDEFFETQYVSE